jgi:hypothetical protein
MSHYDRDAEIAAFILRKGVTRCPTACVVPTQGSPDPADQAALEQYKIARDELWRMKIGARQRPFSPWRSRNRVANRPYPRDF